MSLGVHFGRHNPPSPVNNTPSPLLPPLLHTAAMVGDGLPPSFARAFAFGFPLDWEAKVAELPSPSELVRVRTELAFQAQAVEDDAARVAEAAARVSPSERDGRRRISLGGGGGGKKPYKKKKKKKKAKAELRDPNDVGLRKSTLVDAVASKVQTPRTVRSDVAITPMSAFSFQRTRSGRAIIPPLDHWRNQNVMRNSFGNAVGISLGTEDDTPGVKTTKTNKTKAKNVGTSGRKRGRPRKAKPSLEADLEAMPPPPAPTQQSSAAQAQQAKKKRGRGRPRKGASTAGESSASTKSRRGRPAGSKSATYRGRKRRAVSEADLSDILSDTAGLNMGGSGGGTDTATRASKRHKAVHAPATSPCGTALGAAWSDAELEALEAARRCTSALHPRYWAVVAAKVGTRSARECAAKFQSFNPMPQAKAKLSRTALARERAELAAFVKPDGELGLLTIGLLLWVVVVCGLMQVVVVAVVNRVGKTALY